MEEPQQPEVELGDAPLVSAGEMSDHEGPQSPMEALRAKRDETERRDHVLIPIPEYEEVGLHVRYRLVGRDDTDAIAKKVRSQKADRSESMYRVLVDTMIFACDGFYLKEAGAKDETAELLPPAEGYQASPANYQELALQLKGEPAQSARWAVVYVFGGNEFAVGSHGLLLSRWLNNTNLDVDREITEG